MCLLQLMSQDHRAYVCHQFLQHAAVELVLQLLETSLAERNHTPPNLFAKAQRIVILSCCSGLRVHGVHFIA